jgi:hypothetical protein
MRSLRFWLALSTLAVLAACASEATEAELGEGLDGKTDTWGKHDEPPGECPRFGSGERIGSLSPKELTEASGLAVSRRDPDLLFTHNDSGDGARLFALSVAGGLRGSFTLAGVDAVDLEDLAFGPGPVPGADYLYLGDLGDNDWDKKKARRQVAIYRLREPVLPADASAPVTRTIPEPEIEALVLEYADKPRNAEALLVDPESGEIVVVTKSSDGVSRVYTLPSEEQVWLSPSEAALGLEPSILRPVLTLRFGKGGERPIKEASDPKVTAGDVSADGSEILLRTYSDAYLWIRRPGLSLWESFKERPCPVELAKEAQGESIAFDPWSAGYLSVSEENGAEIFFYPRR